MLSARAAFVLGAGVGALVSTIAQLVTTVVAGGSWLYPKES